MTTTPPPEPYRSHRKEAITDVAAHMPLEHEPDDRMPKTTWMDTDEAARGELHPEEHAELEERFRQLLLAHLELERRVAHMKYLQMFDKIRIEKLADEAKTARKRQDPRWMRLVYLYLPFAFAFALLLFEEFLRRFYK